MGNIIKRFMRTHQQKLKPWHVLPLSEVYDSLKSDKGGLPELEARQRLKDFGRNELPRQEPPAWWEILLRQFKSPLIYVLGIAAMVSIIIQEFTDAGFIAAVLVINAVIGGYQEWRAEKDTQALQKLLQIRATVVRNGEVREVDAEEVVPGDAVWLESGNRVPADVRLITTHGLEIDESLLTGESMAVLKNESWKGEEITPVGDRLSVAYAGSVVTRGRGLGMVVATATATIVGQLALDVVAGVGGKPPLIERVERFSRVVGAAVLSAAAVIAVIGVLRGSSATQMFLFAVALAVSAIPEGLPVAMTVALSLATKFMARRGVIVRRLSAVEGLGSCTFIISDKTGTLTCNELTVREIHLGNGEKYEITGEGFVPQGLIRHGGEPIGAEERRKLTGLMQAAVLCNEGDLHLRDKEWIWRGDAVDLALLTMARKIGWSKELLLERHPKVNEIPFEPEHQFAASYHKTEGQIRVFVKGAPERVLHMCRVEYDREVWGAAAETMAKRGLRVIALAEGEAPADLDSKSTPPQPAELNFLGFIGMIDPLRSGVVEAVESCRSAGISVAMVTGDHPETALAIARNLGLAAGPDQVITGAQLEDKKPHELKELINRIKVFARMAPHQKLELVQAAREAGHFVAVTGDGVNDAPALKASNIGVAMGKGGTDVARDASELVISDDNFATIIAGVEEGRVAYDNVRKVVFLLISTGAAEVVLVCLSVALGFPLPLLPVQILWLNLVTNGIQDVALAFEPNEGGVLMRKPRSPKEGIFDRLMIERTILTALVMGGVGFCAFFGMLQSGWSVDAARNGLLLLMVLFENVHVANSRSEVKSAFKLSPFRNPVLMAGVVIAFLIHVLFMYMPWGQRVLRAEPVSASHWVMFVALALTILVAMEIHKRYWAFRYKIKT